MVKPVESVVVEAVRTESLETTSGAGENLVAQNTEARAVAVVEVIGSMKNSPALERTLAGLSQPQINKIVEGAAQEYWVPNPLSGGATVLYDAAPLGRMLDAVASVKDPNIKARFFEPAAAQLKKIEDAGSFVETTGGIIYSKGDRVNQIRNGLTNILNSDTTGVVGALERSSRDGKGLTMYVKSMIDAGTTADNIPLKFLAVFRAAG
jgi:hypothetical protein